MPIDSQSDKCYDWYRLVRKKCTAFTSDLPVMWVLGLFSESGYLTWMRSKIVSPRTEKQFKVCRPKVWLYMTCSDSCGNQVPPTTTTTTTNSTYVCYFFVKTSSWPFYSRTENLSVILAVEPWSSFLPRASAFHRWGLIGMTQKKHISGFEGLVCLKRSMFILIYTLDF